MSEIIRTKDVCREFDKKGEIIHALKNVNISIEQGTFNILSGRSGSGKTTLLNLLSAIDIPTSGNIYYNEADITLLSEKKRDELRRLQMGLVFQSTALVSLMSALENMEYALSIAGSPRLGRKKLAISWLERMGIKDRRNHMPAEMSGGEQQRVAIARAIAHCPKILFADEPTAELDTKTSFKIVNMFKELIKQNGVTIIMTTHDVNIMDVADKIYTLEDGEITNEHKN